MSDENWLIWGVPLVALGFGAIGYLVVWLGARDFERRYPDSPK